MVTPCIIFEDLLLSIGSFIVSKIKLLFNVHSIPERAVKELRRTRLFDTYLHCFQCFHMYYHS